MCEIFILVLLQVLHHSQPENERIISKPGGRFIYHGIRKGYLELAYKGPSDAYIALFFMHGRPSPPMVEVKLGINKNTESTIRMDNNDYNQVFENTPNLLSPDRFTIFCLKWKAGNMTVRKDHPQGPIVIKSTGCVDFVPHYFAVRSGRGIRGKWILGVNNARAIVDSNPEFQAEHVSELD